ncbi:MAG: acyl carrier protein [Planctomycetaceae bacterium]
MPTPASTRHSEEEIRSWIIEKLCGRMRVDPADLKLDEPIASHGIDSMQVVALLGELEDWLGCRLHGNPLLDYPSINALAHHLAQETGGDVRAGSGGR